MGMSYFWKPGVRIIDGSSKRLRIRAGSELEARQTFRKNGASNSRCPSEEGSTPKPGNASNQEWPNKQAHRSEASGTERTMMDEAAVPLQVPQEGKDTQSIPRWSKREGRWELTSGRQLLRILCLWSLQNYFLASFSGSWALSPWQFLLSKSLRNFSVITWFKPFLRQDLSYKGRKVLYWDIHKGCGCSWFSFLFLFAFCIVIH